MPALIIVFLLFSIAIKRNPIALIGDTIGLFILFGLGSFIFS